MEKLQKEWKPTSENHATARTFIYKTYPDLSTADIESRWADIEAVLAECKNDPWGLRKLRLGTEKHRARMIEEARALKPNLNPDDEKPAKRIVELLPKLIRLDEDAKTALIRLEGK